MELEFQVVGDATPHTDTPRDMTDAEKAEVRRAGRLEGIKLHRAWTHSTLRAAIRRVEDVLSEPVA